MHRGSWPRLLCLLCHSFKTDPVLSPWTLDASPSAIRFLLLRVEKPGIHGLAPPTQTGWYPSLGLPSLKLTHGLYHAIHRQYATVSKSASPLMASATAYLSYQRATFNSCGGPPLELVMRIHTNFFDQGADNP